MKKTTTIGHKMFEEFWKEIAAAFSAAISAFGYALWRSIAKAKGSAWQELNTRLEATVLDVAAIAEENDAKHDEFTKAVHRLEVGVAELKTEVKNLKHD